MDYRNIYRCPPKIKSPNVKCDITSYYTSRTSCHSKLHIMTAILQHLIIFGEVAVTKYANAVFLDLQNHDSLKGIHFGLSGQTLRLLKIKRRFKTYFQSFEHFRFNSIRILVSFRGLTY